jgi:hypothetical protein
VVRRTASRKPREDPMTRTRSKRKTVTSSRPVKTAKRKSSTRPAPVVAASGAVAKHRLARRTHKSFQCCRIERERRSRTSWLQPAGNNIPYAASSPASSAKGSVSTNLVSEPGESGRIYRIIDDMASPAKVARLGRRSESGPSTTFFSQRGALPFPLPKTDRMLGRCPPTRRVKSRPRLRCDRLPSFAPAALVLPYFRSC